MTTVVSWLISLLAFALLFAVFALCGSGERWQPCAGRKAGEARCPGCPAAEGGLTSNGGCPGADALGDEASSHRA